MPTNTTTYSFQKPTIGGDDNAWGAYLNANWDKADDLFDGTTGITPNLLTGWEINGTTITATAAQVNFLTGVTSAIQTQLNAKQNLDATLTALAGVTVAANQVIYATGPDAFTVTSLTAFGRSLIDDTDASAARTTLGIAAQSQATWEAGTGTTESVVSPAKIKAAIDALATQKLSFSSLTSVGTGSNVDVTGIPAGVTEIEVYLVGVSENAASNLLIQFIVGGSPVTSGYVSASGNSGTEVGSTSGFVIYQGTASRTANGTYRLVLVSSGTWVGTHAVGMGVSTAASSGGGSATGVGTVEGIRLSTPGNFDAGSIVVSWR